MRCGRGHLLSPDNLRIDSPERRWRCLQCGRERVAAFAADTDVLPEVIHNG
jgi:hypothetical protein